MQREINVAFQGGGARLISLIAAAHAIADLERNGELKVNAVSGSSAGSIPALLLAAGADFDRLRDVIRKSDKLIKKQFPPLTGPSFYMRTVLFTMFGKPIYSANKFNDLVGSILKQTDIDPEKQLKDYVTDKNLHIVSSDIYQGKSVVAGFDEVILDVLRASCAIPIVFASFKQPDAGQSADGGVFDNMPTDILMSDRSETTPVFAVGFKGSALGPARSSLEYISAIASASVHHRVTQSRQMIGDDMVLELDTSLSTLDFYKIVSVGIDAEYRHIKGQTKNFFQSWLSGSGRFSDPMSKNKGLSPHLQLRRNEIALMDYVSERLQSTPCESKYLRMRVNARCVANPNTPDEIIVEQLIRFPENYIVPAVALPVTIGAGYRAGLECFLHLDSPNGPRIEFTEFVSNDESMPADGAEAHLNKKRRPSAVLLLKGDLKSYAGRDIYILKKELRYGFMADLRDKGADWLAVHSFYWDTDLISLELNVPRAFGALSPVWTREGHNSGTPPEQINPEPVLVPTHYSCYIAAIANVVVGDRLKGVFSRAY